MTTARLFALTAVLLPMSAFTMDVSAVSAIAMDGLSGKVLWSRAAESSRFPASTTKIMTSLLLLEHCKPDDIIVAPPDINKIKESSMHLLPGERVRAKDMLYALMLRSANDGCYAVACHIAGSVPAFADMMNERARQIGCTNTHFHNPNGLNDPEHTTTAHDLALIAREAMKNPSFREAVKTYRIKINRGSNWKDVWMVNHDKWLRKDPTCEGIKTGYTIPAGKCFVGAATRQGWRAITVVLKSKNWQQDTSQMFDWAFDRYEKQDFIKAGVTAAEVKVTGGQVATVGVSPERDAYNLMLKGSGRAKGFEAIEMDSVVRAPIQKGQKLGKIRLRDGEGFEQEVALLSDADVPSTALVSVAKFRSSQNYWIPGGLLVGAFLIRGRTRRRIFRSGKRRLRRI